VVRGVALITAVVTLALAAALVGQHEPPAAQQTR